MSSPVRLQRPRNLTLDGPKSKARVTFKEDVVPSQTNNSSTPSPRKRWCDAEFRAKRKRAHSCSFSWDHMSNKRRKNSGSGAIVFPTKFLLGGNITDPLNLEALDKVDENKTSVNHVSSGACRRSSIVRVIIPPNINDPLNLDACSEDGEEQLVDAISRQRRRRKTKMRKRKRRNSEPGGTTSFSERSTRLCTSLDEGKTPRDNRPLESTANTTIPTPSTPSTTAGAGDLVPPCTTTPIVPVTTGGTTVAHCTTYARGFSDPGVTMAQQEKSLSTSSTPRHSVIKKQKTKVEDKIVSPVVPQPFTEKRRHFPHQRHPSNDKKPDRVQSDIHPPKQFHPKNAAFQYGNYNQYYGYRNVDHKPDPRLKMFKNEWFFGKDVLDIGCNIGHITLCVGRDFAPSRVVGIDIDKKLVKVAQKNVKHYLTRSPESEMNEFPASMHLLYGPLRAPVAKTGQKKFPYNVKFFQSNYVLENDALLETVRPEFDTILCLSVTKWIHLNFGDEGMKRFFKRIFLNLRPGGILILEPQSWPSYTKKRKLTSEIFENYKNIRLFPSQFCEYLTSAVGFVYVQKMSALQQFSRGFDRPVYIYKKPSQEEVSSKSDVSQEDTTRGAVDTSGDTVVKNHVPTLPSPDSVRTSPSQEHSEVIDGTISTRTVPVFILGTPPTTETPDSEVSVPIQGTQVPRTQTPYSTGCAKYVVSTLDENQGTTHCQTSLNEVTNINNINLPQLSSADLPDVPTANLTVTPTANLPDSPTGNLPDTPTASLPDTANLPDTPTASLPDTANLPGLLQEVIAEEHCLSNVENLTTTRTGSDSDVVSATSAQIVESGEVGNVR